MAKRKAAGAIVLCATDLTETCDEALRQALKAARQRKARLVALYVLPDPMRQHPVHPLGRNVRYAKLPEVHARASGLVRAQLDRALGQAASAVDVQIGHGMPHAIIIERAEELNAALIVVGRSADRIGQEAERVVRYAHGPVLVARSSPERGPILVATDLSDAALPAIAAGVDIARRSGDLLSCLHVVDLRPLMIQPEFGMPAALPLTVELQESLVKSARDRLARACRRFRAKGELAVETGDPATVILERAARLPARLLVIGTSGATGLKRMVLGSVAETVVRGAPCSTFVVRLHPDRRGRSRRN